MDKLFFFSHSTQDNTIVLKIADKLGKDNCWLYEWEDKDKANIFKYDSGIADSKIFVLFWSKNASLSPWVKEEVDIGRYRWINELGYRPLIVLLDNTPLPIALRHRDRIDIDKG